MKLLTSAFYYPPYSCSAFNPQLPLKATATRMYPGVIAVSR